MLQRALGDQGTSVASVTRKFRNAEVPFEYSVVSFSFPTHRPPPFLSCRPSRLYPPPLHTCTHRHTHTQTLMDTTWGRCSLAPNVLWRPRSRPPTAAQCVSAPLHTCHTWASVHKRNFSRRTRAYPHWQAQCTTTGGGVLWHLMSFGAPTTALWR